MVAVVAFGLVWAGDREGGERAIAPLRGIGAPILDAGRTGPSSCERHIRAMRPLDGPSV